MCGRQEEQIGVSSVREGRAATRFVLNKEELQAMTPHAVTRAFPLARNPLFAAHLI